VTPATAGIDTAQYTGTVAWKESNGITYVNGNFAGGRVYQAVVTLTPKTGFTFTGVAANSFSYTGATTVTNAADSGIVTIIFPVTDATVSLTDLKELVTAPVKNTAPDTAGIETAQYTGTVAWKESNGITDVSGNFVGGTVYKAVVILTPKAGFTFTGVEANGFAHSGATAISNSADSGAVTITFPATAPDPNADISIGEASVKLYLDGGANPLAHKGSTPISGTGTFTVGIGPGVYTEILWYLNGTLAAQGPGRTSISLRKQTGTYQVTVEATPQGGVKNSGAHTFVVE
jgi:hypothetical protein